MKQTKTRRFLLVVTLMLLVLTLGLGLFFMQPKSAKADGPAIVPVVDGELQSLPVYNAHDPSGVGHGVFWDGNDSQMRLFFRVSEGTEITKPSVALGTVVDFDKIHITAGGVEKSLVQWVAERKPTTNMWVTPTQTGDADPNSKIYQIWICDQKAWFDTITEVRIESGTQWKSSNEDTTGPVFDKEYVLWYAGHDGWQTRADKEKGLEVNYTGDDTIAWGGSIDESKLEVKATPKGSETAVKIDQGYYALEYNSRKSGQMTVTVKYQDLTPQTFSVTVQEADTSKGLKITDIDTRKTTADTSAAWLRIDVDFDAETAAGFTRDKNLIHIEMAKNVNFADFIEIDGKKLSDPSLVNATNLQWAATQEGGNLIFGFASAELASAVKQVKLCAGLQWITCDADVTWPQEGQIPNYKGAPGAILKEDVTLWNAHGAGWQRRAESISATLTDGTEKLTAELGQQLTAEELGKINVKAKLVDGGADVSIDNSKVSIELPKQVGDGNVTITYQDKTCNVPVTVTASKTLKSIEVTNKNYSAERWTYPDFNDLEVKAHFEGEEDGGTVLSRGDYTVSGYDMWAAGDTTEATVTYSYGGTEQTANFTINLTAYTGDRSMRVVIAPESTYNTVVEWVDNSYHFIQFTVRFGGTGFTKDARDLVTAPFVQDRNNDHLEQLTSAHLGDYILVKVSDGTEKTVTEWISENKIAAIANTFSGNLCLRFEDLTFRASIVQVTMKAGMEWVSSKITTADYFVGNQDDKNNVYGTWEGAVLTQDYVLYNGGTSGWLKAVDTLTASYEGTVLQNNNLNKDNLTVMAKHFGEAQPTRLANDAYTVDFSSAEVGDAVQGTVTYRGKTATFTVKVEAPTKTLDRIEVSGTTKFSAARFGTAPALTGLVVTAYFEGEDEGEVLQAGEGGYTVGAMDMWAAEGDHKITVSYTYGTTTKNAEITLAITAPNSSINFDFVEGGSFNGYIETCEWGTTGQGKNGTRFFWQSRYCLTFPITYTGVAEDYPKNVNAIHFEWVTGIHLGEYVKLTYNGQVKTLAELLEGDTPVVKTVGISDNGQFIICFTNADDCMKVTDVTFLTGMQIPKVTNQGIAWEFGATKEQLNQSVELVPGLVLQHDVCLWNADAAGWQKRADSIEATVKAGSKFTAGTADIKSLLEVKAVCGSEKKAITNFTITNYNKDTVGKQNITITYQDRTATLEITVEAAPVTKYDVTFALGDHAASDATAPLKQTADKDAQITLPAAPKAANGYEFDGWYDGTTKAGDANAKYTVTKTVTLTAHWKQVAQPTQKVTVTFNLNGATGTAPASQTIDKGAKATKPATDPVREGYTFGGWYTDANCTTEFDFNGAVNADTTVYAKWTKNTTPDTPVDPDKPADPDKPDDKGEADNGCGSVIGGVGVVLAVMVTLGTALTVIFVKRKKND